MQAFFDCLDLMEGGNAIDRRAHVEQLMRASTDADELAAQIGWLTGTPYRLHMKLKEIEASLCPYLDPALLAISERYAGERLEALALQWQTVDGVQSNDPLVAELAPLSPSARYWLLRMVTRRAIPQLTPKEVIHCLAAVHGVGADYVGRHWFTMDRAELIRCLENEQPLPPADPLGFRLPHSVADGLYTEGIEQANIQGVKVILSETSAWTARGEPLSPFTQLPEGMAVEAIVQLAGRNPNSVIRKALMRKKGLDQPHRIIVTDLLALRGKDVGNRPMKERLSLIDNLTWPEGFAPITHFDVDRRYGSIVKQPDAIYGDAWSGWLRLPPKKKAVTLAVLTWQAAAAGIKLSLGVQMPQGFAPVGVVNITDKAQIKAIKALPLAGKYGPVRELMRDALSARVKAGQLMPNARKKAGYELRDVELVGLTDEAATSIEELVSLFMDSQ